MSKIRSQSQLTKRQQGKYIQEIKNSIKKEHGYGNTQKKNRIFINYNI